METKSSVSHSVVSLLDDGGYGHRFKEHGIPVWTLGLSRGIVTPQAIAKLWRIVKIESSDVVQTWMYHADLLGGVVARLAGARAIVWGIRHTTLDSKRSKTTTKLVVWACARLSGLVPDAIISCSRAAVGVHQELGYRAKRMIVVPNGFDTTEYRPDQQLRKATRAELGIGDAETILSCVGRWDPQKDHGTLLQALQILKSKAARVRCVFAGSDMAASNDELMRLVRESGTEQDVILLGSRSDVPAVINATDLHVMSSAYGEAFPNVLAEAMACGVPCVTTDVGDARLIVGDTGWVVPPEKPDLLATVIQDALAVLGTEGASARAHRCRQRIQDQFSLENMASGFSNVWTSVMSAPAGRS